MYSLTILVIFLCFVVLSTVFGDTNEDNKALSQRLRRSKSKSSSSSSESHERRRHKGKKLHHHGRHRLRLDDEYYGGPDDYYGGPEDDEYYWPARHRGRFGGRGRWVWLSGGGRRRGRHGESRDIDSDEDLMEQETAAMSSSIEVSEPGTEAHAQTEAHVEVVGSEMLDKPIGSNVVQHDVKNIPVQTRVS